MPAHNAAAAATAVAPLDLPLRRCLGHFATGVAIVSYDAPTGTRGLTVNAFTSVSLDPPLVLVCLDKRSRAIGHVPQSPFAVNVLHANQRDLARHFAGRPVSDVAPAWQRIDAVPVLTDCLAWLACAPWSHHDAGDHVIVVGRVVAFGTNPQTPLCFFRGEFIELPTQPFERGAP